MFVLDQINNLISHVCDPSMHHSFAESSSGLPRHRAAALSGRTRFVGSSGDLIEVEMPKDSLRRKISANCGELE